MNLTDTLPTFNMIEAVLTNQEGESIWDCMGQYLSHKDQINVQLCSKKLKISSLNFQAICERAFINNFLSLTLIKEHLEFKQIVIDDFAFRVSNEFKSKETLNRSIMIKLVNIYNAVIALDESTRLELQKQSEGWKYSDIFNHDLKLIVLGYTFDETTTKLLKVPFFTKCQKMSLYEKAFGGYMKTFQRRGSILKLTQDVPDKTVLKDYFTTKKPNFDAKVQAELDAFITKL